MKWAKEIVYAAGNLLGLNLLFRFINRKKIRILMYHLLVEAELPTKYWTALTRDKFLWQMQYVNSHYQPIPASAMLQGNNSATLQHSHRVVVTFDDGSESVYRLALPIAEKLSISISCFVVTRLTENFEVIWADEIYDVLTYGSLQSIDLTACGLGIITITGTAHERSGIALELIQRLKSLPDIVRRTALRAVRLARAESHKTILPAQLMTKESIAEMSRHELVEIGPHSNTHPILSQLDATEQLQEIEECISLLRRWNVKWIPLFAYPNGGAADFDARTIDILKSKGIQAALTTEDSHFDSKIHNMFKIPRVLIGSDISRAEFKARLSGFYYLLKRLWK